MTDTKWMAQAACQDHDPDLWFPENNGDNAVEARAICAVCPVAEACLEYALSARVKYGIWGALDERERRNLTKRRRNAERKNTANPLTASNTPALASALNISAPGDVRPSPGLAARKGP